MWQAGKGPRSWKCSDGLKVNKPGSARDSFLQYQLNPAEEYGEVALAAGQLSVLFLGANSIVGDGVNM